MMVKKILSPIQRGMEKLLLKERVMELQLNLRLQQKRQRKSQPKRQKLTTKMKKKRKKRMKIPISQWRSRMILLKKMVKSLQRRRSDG